MSIIRASFVGCVAILFFFACTPREQRADLVIVNAVEPESIDPAIMTGLADSRVVLGLFEGLMRLDPVTAKGVPGIADRWEILDEGRVYIFHLRSNAVWSTGEPITAHDVVYSWLRVLDPMTAADYAGLLFFLKHGEDYATGKIKDPSLVGVRALDDKTVRVELNGPTPFFLDVCALPSLTVVQRKAIEAHGDRWIMSRPVPTSGAYLLESWRIHDKIRVRKNPRYWDAANTRCEIVDYLPIDSATVAMNVYETGQADIIWDRNVIPTDLVDLLMKRPDCHTFNYLGTYFLRINVTRKPLDDVRIRKAFSLSIDRKYLTEKLNKAGEKPATHVVPKGIPNYDPPEGLGYDPDQARRLLAEAGYPGGKGFPRMHYLFNSAKQHQEVAVELQAMWRKELGIQIELRQVEWKVYLAALSSLDYDLGRSAWLGDYVDPNTFLDLWMSNNGNNRTGWKNPRYDQLVRDGNMQTDPQKRAAMLREAETIVVREDVPIVPLFFYAGINLYDPTKIDGIWLNMLDEHRVAAIGRRDRRW